MSDTVLTNVRQALRTALLGVAAITEATVATENRQSDVQPGAPYYRETLIPGTRQLKSIGARRRIQVSGLLLVDVFELPGLAMDAATAKAEAIVSAFNPGFQA